MYDINIWLTPERRMYMKNTKLFKLLAVVIAVIMVTTMGVDKRVCITLWKFRSPIWISMRD